MLLNSHIFILLFFPFLVLAYFLCNKLDILAGKIILVIGSLIFYAYADWHMLFFLLPSVLCNYLFTYLISHAKWRKIFLAVPVIVNVGLLLFFKYTNFVITNFNLLWKTEYELLQLLVPLGISFITFQQIAYLVTVYRGELERADVMDYLVYILYFPKLLMGPLAEPVDFIAQLNNPDTKKVNSDHMAQGLKMFSFGLFKKALLADTFAGAFAWGLENIDALTSMDCVLVMLAYTFEIYFDFSGYSDMAIGISRMLNITLPMNFDSPYKAVSIRDFWKRWHISLTKFFTKYLYIPLGGSRKGKIFTYVNTMIVFIVSGIWHGAGWAFILWGGGHGILSVFDRVFENVENKIIRPVRWFNTFLLVNILWLLFGLNSPGQWMQMLRNMFSFQDLTLSTGLADAFAIPEALFISSVLYTIHMSVYGIFGLWMMIFLIVAFGICLLTENNYRKMSKISAGNMILAAIVLVWGILCLSTNSEFIYSGF